MRRRIAAISAVAALLWAFSLEYAAAEAANICAVTPDIIAAKYPLARIAAKLRAKNPIEVIVLGSNSSLNSGARSAITVYPMLLEKTLKTVFPGEKISVVSRASAGLTAQAAFSEMEEKVIPAHPDLVVWETGTTDAVKNVDINEFGQAVNSGLRILQVDGIDVVLVDIQYSPQTSSIYNFAPYLDYLWRIGDARDVNVLHRFQIMQFYAENGRFNPGATTPAEQLNNANFVHSCLAHLLAQLVQAAAFQQQP